MGGLPRYLVIIGSGEMAPQMGRVHRSVIRALAAGADERRTLRVAIVDTPYGFQENVDALNSDAVDFFGRRLGLEAEIATLRRADADLVAREAAYAVIRAADIVFSGPGSPSYALAQWTSTEIPTLFADKLVSGGALVVASAAALTLGRLTAPVYEIYKAGEDPFWLPGLDVLAVLGISAAVIPHWDNAEGRSHDTRYCFLGQRRFWMLEDRLPEDVFVLGVDEHTALIADVGAGSCSVRGRGRVTLRSGGDETIFQSGEEFPLSVLQRTRSAPALARTDAGRTEEADLAARVVELERELASARQRAGLVEPLVRQLLELRAQARSMAAYEVADGIRDSLTSLGLEISDTSDGGATFRLPDVAGAPLAGDG